MRTPLLAGNWKMYKNAVQASETIGKLLTLIADRKDREVLLCPPYTSLESARKAIGPRAVFLGAQNVHWEKEGAFTGEVAASMLKEAGCSHAVVGHSERRQYFGETDATVQKRMMAALQAELVPVVCIGETLPEREAGKTFDVLKTQVAGSLAGLKGVDPVKVVIAYEPVWAIGTGKTATPEQAQEAHQFIRGQMKALYGAEFSDAVRILYGGSVKPDNVTALMKQPDIDGGLVGGASLDAVSFSKIVNY